MAIPLRAHQRIWFAEWNTAQRRAREEYERVREEADRPAMCGRRLHAMEPDNIRFDGNGRRHCRQCERDRRARKKRDNDTTDRG